MKNTYSIRKIDNLGRIVVPMDFRKALEIHDWDELRISMEEDRVVIQKERESCTFCGREDHLAPFENRFVCRSCLENLKRLKEN